MAQGFCPGQNTQFWGPKDIFDFPCPECGKPIEFFKDDPKNKCLKCGKVVFNPRIDFGCARWCPAAKECIGPERYSSFIESAEREDRRRKDMERLLSMISKNDEDVKELFKQLYLENKCSTKLFDTKRLRLLKGKEPDLFKRATDYFSRFNSSIENTRVDNESKSE